MKNAWGNLPQVFLKIKRNVVNRERRNKNVEQQSDFVRKFS